MSSASQPVGYMPPHWLDALFAQGKGDYDATWNVVSRNPRFCDAVYRATQAYQQTKREHEEASRKGHHIYGGGPEQNARAAFLHELNQDDVDRSGYGSAPPA